MKLEIEDEQPRKKTSPPDYFSRTVKLKLMSLAGLLLLVVVLMVEARKPENWAWMGFGKVQPDPAGEFQSGEPNATVEPGEVRFSASTTGQESSSDSANRRSGDAPETRSGDAETRSGDAEPNATGDDSGGARLNDDEEVGVEQGDAESEDENDAESEDEADGLFQFAGQFEEGLEPLAKKAAHDFWLSEFNDQSREWRRDLFLLIRHARNRQPLSPARTVSLKLLVDSLEEKRAAYHLTLLDCVSALSDAAIEKPDLNRQYFESKELWEQDILPALRNTLDGGEVTMSQLQTMHSLQLTLDRFAMARVNDRTSMRQPDEGLAWLRAWELAINPGRTEFTPARHIQLSGQAPTFRGRHVAIEGRIQMARLVHMKKNELGIDRYYILWLKPSSTEVSPFCVYSLELPEGFPHVTGEPMLLDEPAGVDGVFFKIRTYQSADESIQECPLILAPSFNWKPESKTVAALATAGWWPGWPMAIAGMLLMPLMAGYVAWRAYTVTKMIRRPPAKIARQQINNQLEELQRDPEIMSDLERVQSLYQNDQLNS